MQRTETTGATVGYETQLWQMADALRGSMDAAKYKCFVLGLVFLKYISDAFEEHRKRLEQKPYADPEDPDEYIAVSLLWVPKEARWAHLKEQARQPTIGLLVDDAMAGIERDNPSLKDVLPKDYANPTLNKSLLEWLINIISNIKFGDEDARAEDVLGRVYEYFLSQFARQEGKKGSEFYTPRCVVKLLVEMLEPYRGRVYNPCCGSSGMLAQLVEFIRSKASESLSIYNIYGQEANYTEWQLAKMSLHVHNIDARMRQSMRSIYAKIELGRTFHDDRFPGMKADFILANPPFNVSYWGDESLRNDKRWQYGIPPAGNANFAWVQHIIHHLAPTGCPGFVVANGSVHPNFRESEYV